MADFDPRSKQAWKRRIIKATKDAGTYQPFFAPVIETLATVLETRDKAQALYEASGAHATIIHTNRGGSANITKNPQLAMIMELNTQALSYWRDLGLTPAGLKKLNAEAIEDTKKAMGPMEALIDALGG